MSYQNVEEKCLDIIKKHGPSEVAVNLGITRAAVSQVGRGERPVPSAWINRILALEGLEVLVLPAESAK